MSHPMFVKTSSFYRNFIIEGRNEQSVGADKGGKAKRSQTGSEADTWRRKMNLHIPQSRAHTSRRQADFVVGFGALQQWKQQRL